jgi:8-amino-7-oxononanoate synthase
MTTTGSARTVDFTSALYLGLRHPSWALRPWRRLTTGVPAALRESCSASVMARQLTALTGCERAVVGTSTLHLCWDLFHGLVDARSVIYMDADLYPIARWGVERAAARGVAVREIPHHDAEALRRRLRQEPANRRPLVVTDGFCPRCGRSAPLGAYLEAAERWGGRLVVDDTQALGVLGRDPRPRAPYGHGGGGSLPWNKLASPDVIVVASLAKGFGVPLAVLAGADATVSRFEATSETRVHCSPPSVAALHAAAHALAVNRIHGDMLRARLAAVVSLFRDQLSRAGFPVIGGRFPVQTLAAVHGAAAVRLHGALRRQRVLTVLRRDHEGPAPRLTCLLTARHTAADVSAIVEALSTGAAPLPATSAVGEP